MSWIPRLESSSYVPNLKSPSQGHKVEVRWIPNSVANRNTIPRHLDHSSRQKRTSAYFPENKRASHNPLVTFLGRRIARTKATSAESTFVASRHSPGQLPRDKGQQRRMEDFALCDVCGCRSPMCTSTVHTSRQVHAAEGRV